MAAISFEAHLDDGSILTPNEEFPAVSKLPLERVVALRVWVDLPDVPPVMIRANHAKGERIRRFTRHTIRQPGGEHIPVEVYEIQRDGETLCRLYWNPGYGPVLSTDDLYF